MFDATFNVLVIQANITQSEGDWQSAMQFCGSPLGSRNPLNTSSDITVNVSSSGDINRLSWIAAYAFYTPWIKMLGLCHRHMTLSFFLISKNHYLLPRYRLFIDEKNLWRQVPVVCVDIVYVFHWKKKKSISFCLLV